MNLSKISCLKKATPWPGTFRVVLSALFGVWLLLVPPALARSINLVALGDSLTAGYGLAQSDGFVPRLTAKLKAQGLDIDIANAGVSGDTTAGALSRLEWSVPPEADGVIVALGGNDALRAIDPQITAQNLKTLIEKIQARGQAVFFIGMRAPPNLGDNYTRAFDAIYPALAKRYGLAYYPFFLEGVAGEVDLNLSDGIHPNANGVDIITDRLSPSMVDFVKQLTR
jgi:acyl-CoA thioesterase-1